MKTKYYIGILLSFCLIACNDFLERSAQDLVIPETTAHYKEMLQGEGYFQKICDNYLHFMLMTDDVTLFDAAKMTDRVWETDEDLNVKAYEGIYTWASEIENSSFTDNCFLYLYSQVMVANICLQSVDETEGTVQEKEILRGQAAFTRAFAYFMLANMYAKPYHLSEPDDLCVPLKLDPTPTTNGYNRATMREIWGLINTDIQLALDNLKDKDISSPYEINYEGALILATRIALYQEDYEKVKSRGLEFLSFNHELFDISGKVMSINNEDQLSDADVINFISKENKEIVFLFGEYFGRGYKYLLQSLGTVFYAVSEDLIHNVFRYDAETKEGDRRVAYWFMPPATGTTASVYPTNRYCYVPLKYDDRDDNEYRAQFALRTGEVYLSLAEAYARQANPETERVLYYLNGLREKRIAPYTPLTEVDFRNQKHMIEYVWEERRRELCFEELHRWWDLRRGTQPEITHAWKGRDSWKLEPSDPAYVLNFPISEREFNPNLIPNARPIRQTK